MQYCCIQ